MLLLYMIGTLLYSISYSIIIEANVTLMNKKISTLYIVLEANFRKGALDEPFQSCKFILQVSYARNITK